MLYQELQKHQQNGQRIRIGLIGAGQMGEGLVCQTEGITAMEVVAIYSRRSESCHNAYKSAGLREEQVVDCALASSADEAIRQGKRCVMQSLEELCAIEQLDVVVEATGIPEIGVRSALGAIEHGHHIVQMNVEADATVGYLLRKKAEEKGVIYTLSSGDEPGSIMELIDFAQTLGFPVYCAGKGKNNRVNRYATEKDPAVIEKAQRFRMNPTMLASFVDGSKTMVEMCSLGNALGFSPSKRGMNGFEASPQNLADIFCPRELGGELESPATVDYAYGIAPGVFIVIFVEHPKVLLDFQYLALGKGPYYALYRPYHLVSLETPISIARCVLQGLTSLASERYPVNEAIAVSKGELKQGKTLGKVGGFDYYGLLDKRSNCEGLLPLGLAEGAQLRRSLPLDHPITYDDVQLNDDLAIVRLRREQDLLAKAAQQATNQQKTPASALFGKL